MKYIKGEIDFNKNPDFMLIFFKIYLTIHICNCCFFI